MLSPAQLTPAVTAVAMTAPESGDSPGPHDPDLRATIVDAIEKPNQRDGGAEYPKSDLGHELLRVFNEIEARQAEEQKELDGQQKQDWEARLDEARMVATEEATKVVEEALLLTAAKPDRNPSDETLGGIIRGKLHTIIARQKAVDPRKPFNGKKLEIEAMQELRAAGITKSQKGALRPLVKEIVDAEFNKGFRRSTGQKVFAS
jgi:hypothetical protein